MNKKNSFFFVLMNYRRAIYKYLYRSYIKVLSFFLLHHPEKRVKAYLWLIGIPIVILFIFSFSFYGKGESIGDSNDTSRKVQSIFASEDEYIDYIKTKINLPSINFKIVDIKRGDNFWKIAKKYGVNIDTLLAANPYWDSLVAKVEQRIIVPDRIGVLHFITDLDEVREILKIYNTSSDKVVFQELPFLYEYYYKFFGNIGPIAVFIPDARPRVLNMTDKMAKQFCLRERFRSPLGGRFSSFFGGRIHPIFRKHRFHNGVDIAARYGTPVGAACEGRVVSTGWNGGYGKTVIIAHPDGFRTLYGHLSRINVQAGSYVKAGRIIGRVGSTGWSTGPHLHFTLWHNGTLVNPMKVLW